MGLQNYAQQACKRACGLLVLAVLLFSSMAQDSSSDTVRVKVVFEGEGAEGMQAATLTALDHMHMADARCNVLQLSGRAGLLTTPS